MRAIAEPTIAGALDVAPRFGLKSAEAKRILLEGFVTISGWRTTGKRLRLKAATLDAYASAFQHPLMDEARQILLAGNAPRGSPTASAED